MKTIAFIGAGAITTSLVKGLIQRGYPKTKIIVSNPHVEKLAPFCQLKTRIITDNQCAILEADIIVLAVKAQVIPIVTHELASLIQQKKCLVISVAGGTSLQVLQKQLGSQTSLLRAMPNIAAEVGQSATVLCANANVSAEQRQDVEKIFGAVGKFFWQDNEVHMDAATALAGCGTAYVALFMQAIKDASQLIGLDEKEAGEMTQQVFKGAVSLVEEAHQSPKTLQRRVTTPKGVTASAIEYFQRQNIFETMNGALKAAKDRSAKLTAMLSASSHSPNTIISKL